MSIIEDGTGKGFSVKVDDRHRMHISGVVNTAVDAAILDGRHFIANSGIITITGTTKNALLYITNTSDTDLFLNSLIFTEGLSVGGSGIGILASEVSPTGGTIISTATPAVLINSRVGSPKPYSGVAYAGFDGATVTGAVASNPQVTLGSERFTSAILATVPKGFTGAFVYTPPTGNTSVSVQFTLTMYYIDEDIV